MDREGRSRYRRAPVSRDLAGQLRILVEAWRAKVGLAADSVGLREFDSAPQPEDEGGVQYIALERETDLRAALAAVPDPVAAGGWVRGEAATLRPRCAVVVASLSGGVRARFFRYLAPAKQLVKENRIVAYLRGDRFESLEDTPAVSLDEEFDCVDLDSFLFIYNPKGFELLFDYTSSYARHVNATIDGIASYIDPVNLDAFRSGALGNSRLLKRLAGHTILNLAEVAPDRVRTVVRDFGFNVRVETRGGKLRLGFDANDPRDLVKLLTESAVLSALTDKRFIATAKTEA